MAIKKEQLNIIEYETLKDLSDELLLFPVDNWEDFYNETDKQLLDSSITADINWESLIDYYLEVGFDEETIIKMTNVRYGNFIDLYYIKEENMYVMEDGTR